MKVDDANYPWYPSLKHLMSISLETLQNCQHNFAHLRNVLLIRMLRLILTDPYRVTGALKWGLDSWAPQSCSSCCVRHGDRWIVFNRISQDSDWFRLIRKYDSLMPGHVLAMGQNIWKLYSRGRGHGHLSNRFSGMQPILIRSKKLYRR